MCVYLFVGVFKLISLSPGETSNCLPRVKEDDKERQDGSLAGGKGTEKEQERDREKKLWRGRSIAGSWNLKKAWFDMYCLGNLSLSMCLCECDSSVDSDCETVCSLRLHLVVCVCV